jgi:YVTN family beta-propeller protein
MDSDEEECLVRIMTAIALSSCLLFADGGLFWQRAQTGSSTAQTAAIKYHHGREELMLATEFSAGTGGLAWLVPLPAEPDVDSVSDQVFEALERYTPASEHQLFQMIFTGGGVGPGAGVTELSSGFIRNYSYQVLKAFGAETLENYLTGHGYQLPSGTRGAFQHYLDQGWRYYFVARVDSTLPANSGQKLGIKLTFVTDSIVYPLYISRISSQAGPVVLYVLADHQQIFPGATLEFSGKVDQSTFFELPHFIDRTCRLTKLSRRFEPDEMEDLCLRDALNDNNYPLRPVFPRFIAANPVTGKAYALDDAGNLAVIQTVDGSFFWSTAVPLRFPCEGEMWSSNGYFLWSTSVPFLVATSGTVVNPRTNRIYVADGMGRVVEVDGANDQLIPPPIEVSSSMSGMPIAVNPVTNQVYVGEVWVGAGGLTTIDAQTRVTRLVPIGYRAPSAIAVDTVRNQVFVTDWCNGSVTVLRGDGIDVRCIPIGGEQSGCWDVAVDQATGKAYIADHGGNRVVVLRPDGTHRELAAGVNPIAVAVNSATHRAYVANYGSNSVTVVDDETVVRTVRVGAGPSAVAVNPVTNRVYVANKTSNSVTVINGHDLTTTQVATGKGPCALAVDQKANRVFVANGSGSTVTVLDGIGNQSWEVSLSQAWH